MSAKKCAMSSDSNSLLNMIRADFLKKTSLSLNVVDEVGVIYLPLVGYDGNPIQMYLERKGKEWIIHDGGGTLMYLATYGISMDSLVEKQGCYHLFFRGVKRKFSVSYDPRLGRFELILKRLDGSKTLRFAQGLIRLSFLVMAKGAGIKQIRGRAMVSIEFI